MADSGSVAVVVTGDRLEEFDALYAKRDVQGRPVGLRELASALSTLRRIAGEGGVEIDGQRFHDSWEFYNWGHARYHTLEEVVDPWWGAD